MYKTIADFRKIDLKALKLVNYDFVQLCKELNLFGAELVGIDGSFFRGNVAKGRIFTKDRLKRALVYVEKDIARYLEEMSQADQQGEGYSSAHEPELIEKFDALRERQNKRQEQLSQLEKSGETQIAEVDADARYKIILWPRSFYGHQTRCPCQLRHRTRLQCNTTALRSPGLSFLLY